MANIKLTGLPSNEINEIRKNKLDSNGQPLETAISDGKGNPCRHCLEMINEGEEFYILAHRPFKTVQPYAEVGLIFLHKKQCQPYIDRGEMPEAFMNKITLIVRGYDKNERIVYGTGKVIPRQELHSFSETMLLNEQVEFIHIRSANNNCYQARIDQL